MVLFLDLDGVLNRLSGDQRTSHKYKGKLAFEEDCVEVLNKFTNTYNCDIVITSSWRVLGGYQTPLRDAGSTFNHKIIGETKRLSCRAEEIRNYVEEHSINFFIIIDDDQVDKNNEYNLRTHFYKVDNSIGLTEDIFDWLKNRDHPQR